MGPRLWLWTFPPRCSARTNSEPWFDGGPLARAAPEILRRPAVTT